MNTLAYLASSSATKEKKFYNIDTRYERKKDNIIKWIFGPLSGHLESLKEKGLTYMPLYSKIMKRF